MGRKIDENSQTEITWEGPPSTAPFNWPVIAEQLRAQPGTWGKLGDGVRLSVINAVRQGKIRALDPADGFEVRTTNNIRESPRTATLFVRWNPDQEGT